MLAALGSAAAAPFAARAQQPLPLVEYLHPGSPEVGARDVAAFRQGLRETGYIEGQNVTVGYLGWRANTTVFRY